MQRITSLDLARGFTVLMMTPVHTCLLYASPEIYDTWLIKILCFIAEGPGAQLLMTLMGMYISFKPIANGNEVLKRSVLLLLAGYALNLLKFVLPLALGVMPGAMQQDLQIQNNWNSAVQLLTLGDILQFAALALPIAHWVRRKKNFANSALFLAAAVLLLSPFLWDANSNNVVINYFLQLAGGQPPKVFFPLLPWLFYPLLGLFIGEAIKTNRETIYKEMLKWGIGWLLFGIIAHYIAGNKYEASFYRAYPWDTIGHAGVVLIALYLWEWLHECIIPNPFFDVLEYCSRNITQIYIIQWLLIIWLLPFFGYHQLDYCKTWVAILITAALTFFTSLIVDRIKKSKALK